MDIAINKLLNEYYQLLNINKFSSPFSLNVIGYNLIWMGLEGVFFFGLILVIEHVSVNPHYKDKWLSFKQSVLSWKSRQSRFRKSLLSTTDESDDIYLDSIVTQTDAKSGNYDDDNDDDDDGDNDSNSDIPDYVKNLRAKQNLESSRSDEKNSPTVIRQNDENEDEDVYAERVRVNNKISRQSPRRDDQDIVVFHDLTKVFNLKNTPKVAVDHLSVALPAGKCFGLLGVNGAGKTTTFRMLTGDLKPTSGDAYIGGYSINNDMNQVRSYFFSFKRT